MTLDDFIKDNDKLLKELFPDDEHARRWLLKENQNFGGSQPAALIINGRSRKVKMFLEAIACE